LVALIERTFWDFAVLACGFRRRISSGDAALTLFAAPVHYGAFVSLTSSAVGAAAALAWIKALR
jgi:hypothetical protein